ncbi:MAG: hypothetical protein LBE44_02015 [Microbacterium hominis]|jgi:hypothetical protein|nr:hypothetical protein [Microbacterium hominis]
MPPSSLLQASRVSKLFRRMLCSRSAETIWRRARLKEGWTDLETKGWNEIQYAKFIDGRECQVCPLPGVRSQLANILRSNLLASSGLSDLRQGRVERVAHQASLETPGMRMCRLQPDPVSRYESLASLR